jgi:hypothetical protein
MNRLILIGNGFDLAHGMKTSYNDFILWYFKESFQKAFESREYYDSLIHITTRNSNPINISKRIYNVSTLVDFYYDLGFSTALFQDTIMLEGNTTGFYNPFQVKIKSPLLKELLDNCSKLLWVDIENQFYHQLKSILNSTRGDTKASMLKELNLSLAFIIDRLAAYLKTIKTEKLQDKYRQLFHSVINNEEILTYFNELQQLPKETLILNFNYTLTVENYLQDYGPQSSMPINVNYIHGKIGDTNNRLIFGFGDELDQEYLKMELETTKGFFEYIKSFWYFKTSNYHNLIRFIDSDQFQIYVWGHSCGLSDRTMLNMIFEHDNCKSIKIFYHQNGLENNFTSLTQEISRHFKNKSSMRRKIVPFDHSNPMPQISI